MHVLEYAIYDKRLYISFQFLRYIHFWIWSEKKLFCYVQFMQRLMLRNLKRCIN